MMVWISRGPQNTIPSMPVTIKVHTPPTYLRVQTTSQYINHYISGKQALAKRACVTCRSSQCSWMGCYDALQADLSRQECIVWAIMLRCS